jgi:hypothetical protein
MIIDLLHNKIVADTISEGFKKSVAEGLVPALEGIYGERMLGIQMYEDHLADDFMLDGIFYYPMTVILDGEQVTHWISWPVGKDFEDNIPYSYKGEEQIDFDLSPDVPLDFETAIIGRARYCEEGLIKVNVHSTSPSPTFLAGKYSQTFIDEMARQLTPQIEEFMSVSGLAESGIELELVFAPATYMEHHSENVTYRRLLMTDKASAPRDFWVKWTNHRDNTPFTVSDSPVGDEIQFEIGEGVHQKLREKEYRYLIRTNNDKYQKAMGKRNITEWRDLIKRAIKRGRLAQIIRQIPLAEEVIMVNAALASEAGLSTADVVSAGISYEDESRNMDIAAELAKAAGIAVDQYIDDPDDEVSFTEVESSTSIEDELLALIAHNKEAIANRDNLDDIYLGEEELDEVEEIEELEEETEEAIEEIYDEEDEEESDEEFEVEVEVEINDENEDEFEEQLEIELVDLPEEDEEPIVDEVTEEPEIEVELEQVEESEPTCEIEEDSEKIEEIEENTVIEPTNVVENADDGDDFIANLEKIKSDISSQITEKIDARIKLEYEKRARSSAEAEIAELRRKHEQLLIENRRLEAQAKKEYEERRRISEQRKLENERLRAELEAKAKAEAIEKERLVEAARSAVEERHRLERERLAEERRRIEDERRIAEDRARAEAEARIQAERALEAERIRLAAQAAAAVTAEEEAVEEPVNKYAHYTYIAKNVKLLFRYSVDPNITVRIQEIIAATLEHFDKSDLHIRVRATVPDTSSVVLEFLEFPKEEMDLLYEIIKVLGASGIGIAKAILEDPKK